MTLILDHIGQIRIPAGAGNARVAKLDDHIDAAELVGKRALGPCHMAGIPVNLFFIGAEHHVFVHSTSLGLPPQTLSEG